MLSDGLGVNAPILAHVEDVEATEVGPQEKCLGRKGVHNDRAIGATARAVSRRKANLGYDDTSLRREMLNQRVGARGIERCTRTTESETQVVNWYRCEEGGKTVAYLLRRDCT